MLFVKDISNLLITHNSNSYAVRDVSTINRIVIHQTDTTDNGSFTPYNIANYHVNTNNWAGIGYHYVILDSGVIYQTQKDTKISYHASGFNTTSIGITITGDHRRNNNEENLSVIYGVKKYLN